MIQGNLSAVEFSPSKNVCLHLPGLSPFLPWEEPGFEFPPSSGTGGWPVGRWAPVSRLVPPSHWRLLTSLPGIGGALKGGPCALRSGSRKPGRLE